MKIFDCFNFFNELDLLEFRLRYLDPYVDHFVITESNLTHSGHPKPYYFKEAQQRFKKWETKIIYLQVRQSTEGLVFEEQKSYNPSDASWKLESEQRNALLDAAACMDDTDMVLLSDLDELPYAPALKKATKAVKPIAFSLLFHVHYLNCQHAKELRWWKGCIAATAKQFRD
jgi:beta-1,4-mannosyl-glycoprotein beta-1,4-N-acetylglucosaminyltransferase